MVKGAASQVLQVPPLKSGVYLGYSVCFDVYVIVLKCLETKELWWNTRCNKGYPVRVHIMCVNYRFIHEFTPKFTHFEDRNRPNYAEIRESGLPGKRENTLVRRTVHLP